MSDSPLTLEEQIQHELNEWRKTGVDDPANAVQINGFIEAVKTSALINLLIQKELFTMDEWNDAFKKQMITDLQNSREGFIQARRAAIAVPRMTIPKGKMN